MTQKTFTLLVTETQAKLMAQALDHFNPTDVQLEQFAGAPLADLLDEVCLMVNMLDDLEPDGVNSFVD